MKCDKKEYEFNSKHYFVISQPGINKVHLSVYLVWSIIAILTGRLFKTQWRTIIDYKVQLILRSDLWSGIYWSWLGAAKSDSQDQYQSSIGQNFELWQIPISDMENLYLVTPCHDTYVLVLACVSTKVDNDFVLFWLWGFRAQTDTLRYKYTKFTFPYSICYCLILTTAILLWLTASTVTHLWPLFYLCFCSFLG